MRGSENRAALPQTFAAFAIVTGIGALSPLVALPAVSSAYGVEGWRLYAVCLSVGSVGAVLVTCGYTISGPVLVASMDAAATATTFRTALRMQTTMWMLVAPATSVVSLLLTGFGSKLTAILLTQSAVATGLSVSWLFIGRRRPLMCLLYDVGPRAAGTLAGAGGLLAGGPLSMLPTLQLTFALCGVALAARSARTAIPGQYRCTRGELSGAWARQRHFLAAQASSMAYINAPVSLLAATAPTAVAQFAAVDRLTRLGLTGLVPLTQGLQGWFPGRARWDERASRRVIAAHAGVGLVAGACLAGLLPTGVSILLQGTVEVSQASAGLAGVIVLLVLLNRALGSVILAYLERGRSIMWSAVAGSSVALVGVPLLGTTGPEGALTAVVLAEAVVLSGQLLSLRGSRQARPALSD